MSTQKSKGTRFETQTVRWLRERLHDPTIDRLALHGTGDIGDVGYLKAHGVRGIVECKSYASWGPADLARWQAETGRETVAAGVDFGLLVVKTPGVGSKGFGRTATYVMLSYLLELAGIEYVPNDSTWRQIMAWVECDLETVCSLMEVSK